jgi:putative Mg2+ transporter-C (MgtC) family protein
MITLSIDSMFRFTDGQGMRQFGSLALAFVLSTLIGLERERRQKSAGMRTHTLVGVGSALFMLVSAHGFNGMLGMENVSVDPSRAAAQIVSGIGFIGGGLIFVRRDAVRGLTTAATIWVTCGVGMACGGGLPLLAAAAVAVHFLVTFGYPWLSRRIAPARANEVHRDISLRLAYRSGAGVLGRVLERCTESGFQVSEVQVTTGHNGGGDEDGAGSAGGATDEESQGDARYDRGDGAAMAKMVRAAGSSGKAEVVLRLGGTADPNRLVCELADLPGVVRVAAQAHEEEAE